MSLTIRSDAFSDNGIIPERYARLGGNDSPPLTWSGVPAGTKSLALIVDDPDAPSGTFVHWLLYRIPPGAQHLPEALSKAKELSGGLRQGRNGFGEIGYDGPQPPSGMHRYRFHLYALNDQLALPSGVSRKTLDTAIRGHVLEESHITGRYGREGT